MHNGFLALNNVSPLVPNFLFITLSPDLDLDGLPFGQENLPIESKVDGEPTVHPEGGPLR